MSDYVVSVWHVNANHSELVYSGTLQECRAFCDGMNKDDMLEVNICKADGVIAERVKRSTNETTWKGASR